MAQQNLPKKPEVTYRCGRWYCDGTPMEEPADLDSDPRADDPTWGEIGQHYREAFPRDVRLTWEETKNGLLTVVAVLLVGLCLLVAALGWLEEKFRRHVLRKKAYHSPLIRHSLGIICEPLMHGVD